MSLPTALRLEKSATAEEPFARLSSSSPVSFSFIGHLNIRVLTGQATVMGVVLLPFQNHSFESLPGVLSQCRLEGSCELISSSEPNELKDSFLRLDGICTSLSNAYSQLIQQSNNYVKFQLPDSWLSLYDALERNTSSATVMVCGSKRTGRSSFVQSLVHHVTRPCIVLDLDCHSLLTGVPMHLAWFISDPNQKQTWRQMRHSKYYFGAKTATDQPLLFLEMAVLLYKHALDSYSYLEPPLIVIHTSAMTVGGLQVHLLHELIRLLRVSHIIHLLTQPNEVMPPMEMHIPMFDQIIPVNEDTPQQTLWRTTAHPLRRTHPWPLEVGVIGKTVTLPLDSVAVILETDETAVSLQTLNQVLSQTSVSIFIIEKIYSKTLNVIAMHPYFKQQPILCHAMLHDIEKVHLTIPKDIELPEGVTIAMVPFGHKKRSMQGVQRRMRTSQPRLRLS